MSSCSKVKNPCKICLGPVSCKTGLQCQGVCESWVHYSCLHYTPGKISDIKSGIIKVTCPCPDCKTTQPKEYRTDELYSCNNTQCPANRGPRCINKLCPINAHLASVTEANKTPPCPLSQCGVECKKYNSKVRIEPCYSVSGSDLGSFKPSSSSEGCPTPPGIGGDTRQVYSVPSLDAVEQMCNTVGQLTNQINDLMCKMKQAVNRGPGCFPCDQKTCSQKGPKSHCPKPCYCPGNPATKKK